MIPRLAPSALCFAVVATCAVLATSVSTAKAHPIGTRGGCPAGYDLIGTTPAYCMSDAGDVVQPSSTQQVRSCPKTYERWAQLCFSSTTGDVVLASDERD